MELTVTQKRDNQLLDRTEVYFRVAHPDAGTPTRSDIKKALAATLNTKDRIVVLDWARSEFGRTSTLGYAKVYPSKERALALESPPILIRNGLLAAPKKAAPPAEAAAAPPAKKETPKPEAPKEAPKPAKEEPKEAPKKEAVAKVPAREEKKAAPPKAEKKEAAKKEEAPKEKKGAAKKEGK